MPELPEVETVRRKLVPFIENRKLSRVEIEDSRLTRPELPTNVASRLLNRRVLQMSRRGKYLVFELDQGLSWIVHLRMTGSFVIKQPKKKINISHARAILGLDDGTAIYYRDVRRFGTWAVFGLEESDNFFASRLGPEPLEKDFDTSWLMECVNNSRALVKSLLLNQKIVAGIGNIYVGEALWRAGLHPARVAGSLGHHEVSILVKAIEETISCGIAREGATLRDYQGPDGSKGTMQEIFDVYGREGKPCGRCTALIEKIRIAGRSTWFCPECQV